MMMIYTIEKMIQRSTVFHENSHVGYSHASEEPLIRSKVLWASSSRKLSTVLQESGHIVCSQLSMNLWSNKETSVGL